MAVGSKINISDNEGFIEKTTVLSLTPGRAGLPKEISVRSARSGKTVEFAFFHDHQKPENSYWKMLFPDPMTGARVFSQRAPNLKIEVVP